MQRKIIPEDLPLIEDMETAETFEELSNGLEEGENEQQCID